MGVYAYLQPVHGTEPAGEEVDIDTSWFDLAVGLTALGLDGEFIVTGDALVASGDEDSDDDGGVDVVSTRRFFAPGRTPPAQHPHATWRFPTLTPCPPKAPHDAVSP